MTISDFLRRTDILPKLTHDNLVVILFLLFTCTNFGIPMLAEYKESIYVSSLDNKIRDIYSDISRNYNPGDKIYIFGFSRGAFAAACLASFLQQRGLLKADHFSASEVDKAFNDFRSSPLLRKIYRKYWDFSKIPAVEFSGLFDTVPGLSKDGVDKYGCHNLSARRFHHILASNVTDDFQNIRFMDDSSVDNSTLEYVRDGDHCDIGGGWTSYPRYKGTLSNCYLRSIAKASGLPFKFLDSDYYPCNETAEIHSILDMY